MASRHPLLGPSLTISCSTCPVRGGSCADCVVAAVLAAPPVARLPQPVPPQVDMAFGAQVEMTLDLDERAAVDRFARAGLVSAGGATRARARSTTTFPRTAAG